MALVVVLGLSLVSAVLVLSYLVLFRDGAKNTGRWGSRPRKEELGASPYREGESTQQLPQGAPIWLRLLCWVCTMGGVATTGFLAPAGLLLLIVLLDQGPTTMVVPVLAVSISGFPAGVYLVRAARRVARHEAVKASAFRYLYIHHGCVVLTMTLVDVYGRGIHVAPWSTIHCGVLCAFIAGLHRVATIIPTTPPITPPTPIARPQSPTE